MKKLFVCSEFYAGQLPFASAIVNAIHDKDTFGIFVCTPQCDYRKSIIPNGENYLFIDFPENKFQKLLHIVYPSRLINEIEFICKKNEIKVIHLLTLDSSLAVFLRRLKKRAIVYYTVHDLIFHEKKYKYHTLGAWQNIVERKRVSYLINHTNNLVTCNAVQYEWMKKKFKDRNIFFHNFPSLVTKTIQSGSAVVPELKGIKNYLLFFGMIELYKGVENLYNAYINSDKDRRDKPLVIAGKGPVYFERDQAKEHHVVFINRYIDDREIKELYTNAFCVIYPYISGTQSGILSLSYYFKIPAIVSDIPFFKTMTIDQSTAITYDSTDPAMILQKVKELEDPIFKEKIVTQGYLYYQKHYDEAALRQQLLHLFCSFNKSHLKQGKYPGSDNKSVN